jgi:DNA-binding protein H-NS
MRHVEADIKMLDPAYNLGKIAVKRRKPNKWFKRGTLYRRALDVLRTTTEAMTASEIAAAILTAEGVESASKEDVQAVAQGIQHGLSNHAGRAWSGLARESPGGGN